jgi:hypothetical protein
MICSNFTPNLEKVTFKTLKLSVLHFSFFTAENNTYKLAVWLGYKLHNNISCVNAESGCGYGYGSKLDPTLNEGGFGTLLLTKCDLKTKTKNGFE